MRAYAVLSGNPDHHPCLDELRYPYVLTSYMNSQDVRDLAYHPQLLLDSGAFTVWTMGRKVDIDEYLTFANEMVGQWPEGTEMRAFNLDVIPGTPTRPPTRPELLAAAQESGENAEYLRSRGLPVIEVYHRYEPISVLTEILERRRPGELISIGGLVGTREPQQKKPFLDAVFAHVRDWCGGWDKLVPIHGLGVSVDAPLGRRYPWYSVDSSTWITARNFNLHTNRSGELVERNRTTSPRTTIDHTELFTRRRLARWLRVQDELTRLWERRGVCFTD